jgi:hypothetical protein
VNNFFLFISRRPKENESVEDYAEALYDLLTKALPGLKDPQFSNIKSSQLKLVIVL